MDFSTYMLLDIRRVRTSKSVEKYIKHQHNTTSSEELEYNHSVRLTNGKVLRKHCFWYLLCVWLILRVHPNKLTGEGGWNRIKVVKLIVRSRINREGLIIRHWRSDKQELCFLTLTTNISRIGTAHYLLVFNKNLHLLLCYLVYYICM